MNNREKRLIAVVGILLVLLGVYYLAYKPMMATQKTLEAEITTLEADLAEIEIDYVKMAEYEASIKQANVDIEAILSQYPAGLSQEAVFKMIFDFEEAFKDLKITSLNFSPIETLSYSDENNDANTMYSIKQSSITQLQVSYENLKDILTFVSDYPNRTVLKDLSLSYDGETDKIAMSLNLNAYGIVGGDRVYEVPEFEDVPTGKTQVFESPDGVIIEREKKTTRPSDPVADIFIRLKPTQGDIDAQIIGLMSDDDQSEFVTSDLNAMVDGVVRISKSGNQYYVNYDTAKNYKTKVPFDKGDVLELTLYSSVRVNDEDLAGMNLTVINETEDTLYINKLEEDKERPRLIIVSKEGDIVVED